MSLFEKSLYQLISEDFIGIVVIDLLPGLAHSFLSLVFTFFHSRVVLVVAS